MTTLPAPSSRFERTVDAVARGVKNYALALLNTGLTLAVGLTGFFASDEGIKHLGEALSLAPDTTTWLQAWMVIGLVGSYVLLAAAGVANLAFSGLLTELREKERAATAALDAATDRATAADKQHTDRVAALEGEHEQLRAATFSLWKDNLSLLLQLLFREHGLTADDRVSVYLHDDQRFRVIARYSMNAEHVKIRRTEYPDSQGVLAKAWQRSTYSTAIKAAADTSAETYYARQEAEGIPRAVAEKFRMKSRAYAARRLDRGRPFGVILFESTRQDGLSTICPNGNLDLRDHLLDALITSLLAINIRDLPDSSHAKGLESSLGSPQ